MKEKFPKQLFEDQQQRNLKENFLKDFQEEIRMGLMKAVNSFFYNLSQRKDFENLSEEDIQAAVQKDLPPRLKKCCKKHEGHGTGAYPTSSTKNALLRGWEEHQKEHQEDS